jgi:hypothetical protein
VAWARSGRAAGAASAVVELVFWRVAVRVAIGAFNGTAWRRSDRAAPSGWGLLMERSSALEVYTEVVLPALQERLDSASPEFGWRRDRDGWVATDQEFAHRVLGVRADRVVAHGPAPRGFLVHGCESVLWTAYVNGGLVPRGAEFVRTVEELAVRAGVDRGLLDRGRPRDRRCELLQAVFALGEAELRGERRDGACLPLRSVVSRPARSSNAGSACSPTAAAWQTRSNGTDSPRRR